MQPVSRPDSTSDAARGFAAVSHVEPPRESRNPRAERWIIVGWALILLKCAAMWWLLEHYHAPIHPLWLVGPTLLFGLLATAIYVWRD